MREVRITRIGDLSNDEVLTLIEGALRENKEFKPRGIRVSNSLHQRGISGEYNGVPIAMDPRLYPEDQVEVVFDDK